MVFHVNKLEGTLCQHSLLPMMHSVKRGLQAQSLRAWLRLQTHPCQVSFCPKYCFFPYVPAFVEVPFLDCQWSTIWICSCGGGDCGRSNYLEFIRDCLGFGYTFCNFMLLLSILRLYLYSCPKQCDVCATRMSITFHMQSGMHRKLCNHL